MFFSRIFFDLNKNGRVRPILDLSALNKMLRIPSFRMETIEKIVKNVCGSLWGSSIDLEDAYLHVPIAWEFHRYFAFVLGNRTFVFQYLPFGLSPAPWAFSRVMKPIKAFLHRKGVLVFSFLDDFLILANSPQLLRCHTIMTLELLQKLAFAINWEKSSLLPLQKLEYLGVMLDLQLEMSQINRYRAPVPSLPAFFCIWYSVSSPKKFCKVSAVSIGVSVTRYHRYFGIRCAVLDIKNRKYLYK